MSAAAKMPSLFEESGTVFDCSTCHSVCLFVHALRVFVGSFTPVCSPVGCARRCVRARSSAGCAHVDGRRGAFCGGRGARLRPLHALREPEGASSLARGGLKRPRALCQTLTALLPLSTAHASCWLGAPPGCLARVRGRPQLSNRAPTSLQKTANAVNARCVLTLFYALSQTLMAFVAGTAPGYDAARCVKLALVHDVAEAIVGDLTPHCGVTQADKHARERAAMAHMQLLLGERAWASAGAEMLELWEEYEGCSSREARLVKDLDKLEMILQAHEYEQAQGRSLDEFFRSTAGAFLTPLGQALAADVVARRRAAADKGAGGAALAQRTQQLIGDDLADLGNLGDGFGA